MEFKNPYNWPYPYITGYVYIYIPYIYIYVPYILLGSKVTTLSITYRCPLYNYRSYGYGCKPRGILRCQARQSPGCSCSDTALRVVEAVFHPGSNGGVIVPYLGDHSYLHPRSLTSPLKSYLPSGKVSSQPPIFQGLC